jgi:galactose mutarotase-like enzyme
VILQKQADEEGVRLRSALDFAAQPRLMAAFPFAHELELDAWLRESELQITTTLRATGERAVPISFGYHPYFVIPGAPRAEWAVDLPVTSHIVVDDRMIPTGAREPATNVTPGPLGIRTFDDGYADVEPGTTFVLSGAGRRIEVSFDRGYPVAVVYAPANDDVVCFEPMTAPTNALLSGDGLRWVQAGDQFSARFSIKVSRELV